MTSRDFSKWFIDSATQVDSGYLKVDNFFRFMTSSEQKLSDLNSVLNMKGKNI